MYVNEVDEIFLLECPFNIYYSYVIRQINTSDTIRFTTVVFITVLLY